MANNYYVTISSLSKYVNKLLSVYTSKHNKVLVFVDHQFKNEPKVKWLSSNNKVEIIEVHQVFTQECYDIINKIYTQEADINYILCLGVGKNALSAAKITAAYVMQFYGKAGLVLCPILYPGWEEYNDITASYSKNGLFSKHILLRELSHKECTKIIIHDTPLQMTYLSKNTFESYMVCMFGKNIDLLLAASRATDTKNIASDIYTMTCTAGLGILRNMHVSNIISAMYLPILNNTALGLSYFINLAGKSIVTAAMYPLLIRGISEPTATYLVIDAIMQEISSSIIPRAKTYWYELKNLINIEPLKLKEAKEILKLCGSTAYIHDAEFMGRSFINNISQDKKMASINIKSIYKHMTKDEVA